MGCLNENLIIEFDLQNFPDLSQQINLVQLDRIEKTMINNTNNTNMSGNLEKLISNEVDYPSLFRGLSSFELNIPQISIPGEAKMESKDPNENEPKIYTDLSEILLREQSLTKFQMPANETFDEKKMLSQLNLASSMLKLETTKTESMSDETSDTQSSDSQMTSDKSLGSSARQKISLKRLSDSSATSSLVEIPRSNRGRKPAALSGMQNSNTVKNPTGKKTKKQLMLETATEPVVCFGNKVVVKDTDEYHKRRNNNNDAVKKCRQKLLEKQKEREDRMKTLDDENKKLTGTVESLNKELNVLKNIIIQMSPQKKLPDYIQNLIKQLEET